MPLGFHLHPGGMSENSPTFQHWVSDLGSLRPEGTADSASSAVPSGLFLRGLPPNVETLGYYQKSLRDKGARGASEPFIMFLN
jgi:hypothetical protein